MQPNKPTSTINDRWAAVFEHSHIHIDALIAINDTLPFPTNVIADAKKTLIHRARWCKLSNKIRVIELLKMLLFLSDKVVPDCLKTEPSHKTASVELWTGYDPSRSHGSQKRTFFEAGGYRGVAPSREYEEWIQDIHTSQYRWGVLFEKMIDSLRHDELFDGNFLPDEMPLTRRTRKKALEKSLAMHGLTLREDSRLCSRYILYGGDLDKVVEVAKEMDFLFRNTHYQTLSSGLKDRNPHASRSTLESETELCKLVCTDEYMKENPERLDLVPSSLFVRLSKLNHHHN